MAKKWRIFYWIPFHKTKLITMVRSLRPKQTEIAFDAKIASLAIEYALQLKGKQGLEIGNSYIVVGNSKGKILATSTCETSEGWGFAYDLVAERRFKITVNTGEPVLMVDDDTYITSWIEGDIIATCSSDVPYIDEFYSKQIVSIARALLFAKKVKME